MNYSVQAWLLWNQRNPVTHGGGIQEPSRLVRRAVKLLEEFEEAQQLLGVQTTVTKSATWTTPPENCYKLNFDAAIFKDINASGFSVVIRNERGEVMAALAAKGPPVHDSEEAEVLACRTALEFAVDAGFAGLILEGDNVTVVRNLEALRGILSCLGHLYGDVQCLRSGLHAVSVSCVGRSANLVAHSLAKFAKGVEDEFIWLEESPHQRWKLCILIHYNEISMISLSKKNPDFFITINTFCSTVLYCFMNINSICSLCSLSILQFTQSLDVGFFFS